jgi:hypothetical protein
MKMIIKKVHSQPNEYMAYIKPRAGFQAVLAYFKDDIPGSISLFKFYELNKSFFKDDPIDLEYDEKKIKLKNHIVADLIKNGFGRSE